LEENVPSTFSPRDRIDQLTMDNLDIADMREKLRIYSQLGQRDASQTRELPEKTSDTPCARKNG